MTGEKKVLLMFSERNRNGNEVSYFSVVLVYLTIIPRARMGSESIAREAEKNPTCWSKISKIKKI